MNDVLRTSGRYEPAPRYTIGLDLGKTRDHTALCILERCGEGDEAEFHARHLQRFPLGTAYPVIVVAVAKMIEREPLLNTRPRLAIDETGVGAPVADLFRQAKLPVELHLVHITSGSTESYDNDTGVRYVPKRNLVSVVQVALQTDKLKIASSLPEAATLVRELQGFEVKITESANDTYGAWREGSHDDLVLAVALALHTAKRRGKFVPPLRRNYHHVQSW